MQLKTFLLEDYYAKHEFSTQYMLSSSDPETWSLNEILTMANEEELDLWNNQSFGYTEVKGLPELRKRIAQNLYSGLDADNILCFAGAEEGIFCSLLTLCNLGDHVIVLGPCYQSLSEIPAFTRAELTIINLQEKNNWQIDLDAIKKVIRSNTKLVIINFPHNPTGQIISQSDLEQLTLLLDQQDIRLFSDEVYQGLGSPEEWAKPVATLYSKGISLNVLSKAYGLPGLRIGWIATQDRQLLKQIEKVKQYTSLCNSGPAEIIGLIALRNKQLILQRNNEIVRKNLNLLNTFFERYKKYFSWVRPEAGCTGFVKYLSNENVERLCAKAIENAGVLLLPGTVYGTNSNHFRIGFGRKNFPEALKKFEQFFAGHIANKESHAL